MQIIVNADDFGMTHEKNIAIDEMMRKNICTKASLVVNTPWTEEAVSMAFNGGYEEKISLHINLTTGYALSDDIKKLPLYYQKDSFIYRPIITQMTQIIPRHIKVLRKEIEAQIQRYSDYGLKINSIDSHNWVHLRLPVWIAIIPLLKEYNISVVRPMWTGYKRKEIASPKWSKYFKLMYPIMMLCKKCRIIQHTSNIEQFLLEEDKLKNLNLVEVFTHPDLINGQIVDVSSSYKKQCPKNVIENVNMIEHYKKTTMYQALKQLYI